MTQEQVKQHYITHHNKKAKEAGRAVNVGMSLSIVIATGFFAAGATGLLAGVGVAAIVPIIATAAALQVLSFIGKLKKDTAKDLSFNANRPLSQSTKKEIDQHAKKEGIKIMPNKIKMS